MDLETRKSDLLERIHTEHRRLEQNLDGLTEVDLIVPGVNGDWAIKDLLAHLADWEQRFLGWYEAGKQGDEPSLPAPGMTWDDIDALNQMIYEKHYDRPLEEVLDEFHSSYEETSEAIDAMSPVELFEPGYYPWTSTAAMASYATAYTADHYRWAKNLIRKWLKGQAGEQKRTVV
jgi:hypothetical protein